MFNLENDGVLLNTIISNYGFMISNLNSHIFFDDIKFIFNNVNIYYYFNCIFNLINCVINREINDFY
jgi:hypothetical protein